MPRQRKNKPIDDGDNFLDVETADCIADDLPDGAYWAMMEELTGMDVCDIAEELANDCRY